MKPWITRIFAGIGIVAILAIVPAACISQPTADKINNGIDSSAPAIDTALTVMGHPELIPLAHAGEGISKWVVGLLVTGTAVVTGGGVHVANRIDASNVASAQAATDTSWDKNLTDLANLAKQLASAVPAAVPTNPHLAAQAAIVGSFADRLLAATAPVNPSAAA